MCIAIVKTKDGKITDNELRNCFDSNPDGAGIAYSKNGKLYMVKGIFDENEFIKQYHEAEKQADGAMLIHCRISTSGKVDKDNCHPHVVNDNCVMIHNGILDIDVPKDSKVSDTVIFVNELLKPLPKDFMLDKGIMNMITHIIGSTNKFCFLNGNGDYAIANEKAGHWKDGVWFSNSSYKSFGYGWGKFGKKTKYGYYDGYGWYDDYEEDYCTLSTYEKEKLEAVILNLTPEQLVKLGELPVYDFWTASLKRASAYDGDGERYLDELDTGLYELYDEMYYDAIEQVFTEANDYEPVFVDEDDNEVKPNDLSEDDKQALEDWKQYIGTRYSIGTTEDEDEEFNDTYEDYSIDVNKVYDELDYDDSDEDYDEVIDVDYSTEDTYASEVEDDDLTEEEYNELYHRDNNTDIIKTINNLQKA